eukprot:c10487_g1_i2.p1 GENE.c10487_g1_i2~~c10487_g1_i2.p1  ORF type:complete len:197 (-),score=83.31 c10487_g1_i2:38-628(-)
MELARHITYVHRHSEPPPLEQAPIAPSLLRKYIAQARKLTPHIPRELTEHIVEQYVAIRSHEANARAEDRSVTARSLLSILRISQALARLRFGDMVEQADVDEAIRLLEVCKSSVTQIGAGDSAAEQKPVFILYDMILDMARKREDGVVSIDEIRQRMVVRGLTEAHLQECLEDYTEINVLQMSEDGEHVMVVNEN